VDEVVKDFLEFEEVVQKQVCAYFTIKRLERFIKMGDELLQDFLGKRIINIPRFYLNFGLLINMSLIILRLRIETHLDKNPDIFLNFLLHQTA
jgi:hypothetical protein